METDFYGLQMQIWRFIRAQRREIRELTETNKIDICTWTVYHTDLFRASVDRFLPEMPEIVTGNVIDTREEINKELEKLKNRKSPG